MARTNSSQHKLEAHLKRLWVHGFLMGFGVVSLIILILVFVFDWLPFASEGQGEATPTWAEAPATPEKKPAPVIASMVKPAMPLKDDLESVLARMAEANQKKDLPLLLSLYDPNFPDLSGKSEEMSRIWAAYDYQSLRFRIEEVESATPGNATAKVVWRGKTRNRATGELKDLSKIYQVEFSNASGQWRIKHLKKGEISGGQKKSG